MKVVVVEVGLESDDELEDLPLCGKMTLLWKKNSNKISSQPFLDRNWSRDLAVPVANSECDLKCDRRGALALHWQFLGFEGHCVLFKFECALKIAQLPRLTPGESCCCLFTVTVELIPPACCTEFSHTSSS
jgi:hypothetical protein